VIAKVKFVINSTAQVVREAPAPSSLRKNLRLSGTRLRSGQFQCSVPPEGVRGESVIAIPPVGVRGVAT